MEQDTADMAHTLNGTTGIADVSIWLSLYWNIPCSTAYGVYVQYDSWIGSLGPRLTQEGRLRDGVRTEVKGRQKGSVGR